MRAGRATIWTAVIASMAAACVESPDTAPTSTSTAVTASTATVPATTTTTIFSIYPPPVAVTPDGEWRTTVLDVTDEVLGFAELMGNPVMLVRHADDGLIAYRLGDDGWEAIRDGTASVTKLQRVEWGPMAGDGNRVVVTLTGKERGGLGGRRHRQLAFVSTTDGDVFTTRAWSGAYISDITTDGDRWVALGKELDESGAFVETIWLSSEGDTWELVRFGPAAEEMFLESVALGNGTIVVIARPPRTTTRFALSSTDGHEWRRVPLESGTGSRVHFVDGRFEVATGSRFGESAQDAGLWSLDGQNWEAFTVESGPPNPALWGDGATQGYLFGVDAPSGRDDLLVTAGTSMHRTDLLYCYDDSATCRRSFGAIWIREDRLWRRIELDIPGGFVHQESSGGTIIDRAAYVAGTLVVVGLGIDPQYGGRYGRWLLTWHAVDGSSLPASSPPLDTSPPLADYAQPEQYGDALMPGVEYAIPITDYCGALSYLGTFGDVVWRSDNIGAEIDPSWPSKEFSLPGHGGGSRVFGLAVLVAEDLVEYRIPGRGVIATFHPGTREGLVVCA